ncbi:hypothetical protein, partial [Paracoccus sanguinis]|uniref:hypothetical protein n=1 Tax=Paracoccus sanguinis TaxID=1545044 RepID=UPI00051FEF1C
GRGGAVETLIRADQITGAFDDIEIIGLASDRGARIVIDHDADEVKLMLTRRRDNPLDLRVVGQP